MKPGSYPEYVPRDIDLVRRGQVQAYLSASPYRGFREEIMEALDSNPSAGLPYHGTPHLYVVALSAKALAWEECFSYQETFTVFMAGLFHDFDHQMEDDDTLNVKKAVEAVRSKLTFMDDEDVEKIVRVIESSRYPYQSKSRDLLESALRDADILFSTVMMPDAQHFRNGLFIERGIPATEQDSLAFVIGHGLETEGAAHMLHEFMSRRRYSARPVSF